MNVCESPLPPPSGLTAAEVEASDRLHGKNSLPAGKRAGFFRKLLESFGDPIIKILLAALAVNLLLLFRNANWFEAAGIAFAVFLATFVSTLSEYGSESAFLRLQEEASKSRVRVKRSGKLVLLPLEELVVGDIVLLQAGERIPADGVILSGTLSVDQSPLSGESREVVKRPGRAASPPDLLCEGQLFRGCIVCDGEGVMEVRSVGAGTFYGSMAAELREDTRESPLRVRLGQLAVILSRIGYVAAIFVALADLFNSIVLDCGMDGARILEQLRDLPFLLERLLHAVTLAMTVVVVAVPEGLPMMITVVLSSNMSRMLKDHVLVRKLVGIETSGSLNLLFTDKTGTLTKGVLTFDRFIRGDGRELAPSELKRLGKLNELFSLSCRFNTQSSPSGREAIGGNATDRALLRAVLPLPGSFSSIKPLSRIPFDSTKKYSAATLSGGLTLVKGAPEKLLPGCTHFYSDDGSRMPLSDRKALEECFHRKASAGERVLAVATATDRAQPLSGLTLIGLVCLKDPLRPEIKGAVRQVLRAGIQTVMITGDSRDTAAAIAKEAGLLDIPDALILTGTQLAEYSDGELKKLLPRLRVVARALPTDKSRLVRLGQELELVVGMTGDGINDAPALKKADVGFAMGSGTEIAREAGDIVILNDNFASIARAVLYGRTIFKSIRKFIVFQLTMNLCAVGISIIGPFIGIDTPVTVVQMLWINIIMDTLAGLAFAGEPPLAEYMDEPPKRRSEPVISRYMLTQILSTGLFTIGMLVYFLKSPRVHALFRGGRDDIFFMTAFFALFIFSGILNGFNARTHRMNLAAHLGGNPAFLPIMLTVTGVQLTMIYYGGSLFRTGGLALSELGTVLLFSLLVIPADLTRKLILRITVRDRTGLNLG